MDRTRVCAAIVVFLALTAFAVRAASLDAQSLWRDEVDALRFATAPLPQVVDNFTRPGWNGPLYFFLLRGWIALTGTSEYAMRFFSLCFGVLCVPLTYIVACRLLDRSTALIAALLVTTSPYLTWYSQEVKMYTLVPALALLAIYGLRRAIEGDGWRWWGLHVVATSLAFYAHILAALLIPVQAGLYVAWWPRARKRWRGALISVLCLVLPYVPLAVWQLPFLFQDSLTDLSDGSWEHFFQAVLASWRTGNVFLLRVRQTGFTRFSLGQTVHILLDYWSIGEFGTYGWGWPWGTVLMGGLAILGLLRPWADGVRSGKGLLRRTLGVALWMAAPLLMVWFVSQWQPLFTDRYVVWSAPAFYLLIASGLTLLLRWGLAGRAGALILLSLILVLNGFNLHMQVARPGKSDFRAAAAYVAQRYGRRSDDGSEAWSQRGERGTITCATCTHHVYLPLVCADCGGGGDLIVFQIPHARYTFDYYFPHQRYPWADGVYTNHRFSDGAYMMNEAAAAQAMERMTAGHEVVWLVASETWMWDERGLVQSWMDDNLTLTDEASFKWVEVYRYRR